MLKISPRHVIFIVFAFIILTGLNSCYSVYQADNSYGWKTTTGTVETSHVINATNNNVPDQLFFRYDYAVNGHSYSSGNVIVPTSFLITGIVQNNFVDANQFSSQHPVGSSITVYYNPQNPSEATIENGLATFAQYLDIVYIIIVSLSFIVAVFTYKKNPFYPESSGAISRIIFTQFLNVLVLGVSFLYLIAFLLVNLFLFIFMLVIAYLSVFSYSILIKFIQQIFLLPNIFFESALYLLLGGTIILFFLFIKKGVYSLLVKFNPNYYYYTNNYSIYQSPDTGKWNIKVEGYYVVKEGEEIDFEHVVGKSFNSESKAEKFYQKHIQQDYDTSQTKRGIFLTKKSLYILKNNDETKENHFKLSYSFYGYLLLFLSLSFLLAYDFMIYVLIGIRTASLDYLVGNIFNRINFPSTHQYVFSDNLFITVIGILGIVEVLFLVFTLIVGAYIFYLKIYKVYLFGGQAKTLFRFRNNF